MSKNQAYAEKYAEAAMEQMKRYGSWLPSFWHKEYWKVAMAKVSWLRENNHFGIKATSSVEQWWQVCLLYRRSAQ